MFKISSKKILISMVGVSLTLMIFNPMITQAEPLDLWGKTKENQPINTMLLEKTGLVEKDLRVVVAGIIKLVLSFLGIMAVVIVLIGGFKWMTAGGNDDQIGDAKKWISAGVVGLLIILAAYSLANFAITQLVAIVGTT